MLEKSVGVPSSSICVSTDNYNVKKLLEERFSNKVNVMFSLSNENFT